MILTCPNCSTRYLVDPVKLGAEGRLVRCGKCSHTWHQTPPEDMPRQVEPIPLAIEPRPIPPGSNLPAFPPRPKPKSNLGGWAVLVLAVVAVVGGGLLAREPIVQAWPNAAKLYRTVGLIRAPADEGLVLRNITSKRTVDHGVPVLVVEGQVANISKEAKTVPPLVAALRDARQREVRQWTFSASEAKLLPGEVVNFSTSLRNPSNEAADISIALAPDRNG